MEDVSEPGEGGVLVALVEQLDLLADDLLRLRARFLVEVQRQAWLRLLGHCGRREGEERKEEEDPSRRHLSLLNPSSQSTLCRAPYPS